MRGAKQKEMFEISDLRREILHLEVRLSVCPTGDLGSGYFLGSTFYISIFLGFQKTEFFGDIKIV